MKSLYSILTQDTFIDCHANIIGDYAPSIQYPYGSILMIENGLINSDTSFEKFYDKLEKYKNDYIISANGKNVDEILSIVNKGYNTIIGEIKTYKCYFDQQDELNLYEDYSISLDKTLADTLIPIMVHCDLSNMHGVKVLEEILKINTKRKVVLCHSGINDVKVDKNIIFNRAIEFQHKYNNLWLEISWKPCIDFFDDRKLSLIDTDRLLIGSDITIYDENQKNEIYDSIKKLSRNINLKRNIENLINIHYAF
jgi:hypothetical protein